MAIQNRKSTIREVCQEVLEKAYGAIRRCRRYLRSVGYAGALTAGLWGLDLVNPLSVQAANPPPNIIFILVDDLGWTDINCHEDSCTGRGDDCSCAGNRGNQWDNHFFDTPNIKQLREQSMRFTRAYTACPFCKATRMSILTGKYPHRLDMAQMMYNNNMKGGDPRNKSVGLNLCETTIAEALDAGGCDYNSAFIGKWHGHEPTSKPFPEIYRPENQGFDLNISGSYRGGPYHNNFAPYSNAGYWFPYGNTTLEPQAPFYPAQGFPPGLDKEYPPDKIPQGSPLKYDREEPVEYLTDRLTLEAMDFIDNAVGKDPNTPFFLYLSHYGVHAPFRAKRKYMEYFEDKSQKDFTSTLVHLKLNHDPNDCSGNGYHGQVQGTPHWGSGKIDGAWQGNGKDYLVLPDQILDTGGQISYGIFARVKLNRKSGIGKKVIFEQNGKALLYRDSENYLASDLATEKSKPLKTTTAIFDDAGWHDVGLIYNYNYYDDRRNSKVTTVRLYVDGIVEAISGNIAPGSATDGLGIGRSWKGRIDDIRIETGTPHINITYAAMVKSVDDSLGALRSKLAELDLTNNTIIVFTSDNGGHNGGYSQHLKDIHLAGSMLNNSPLRGRKLTPYEEGNRVPLLIYWPNPANPEKPFTGPNSTCDTAVCCTDFFPTFLEMAYGKEGFTRRKYPAIDGVSMVPLLTQTGFFDRTASPQGVNALFFNDTTSFIPFYWYGILNYMICFEEPYNLYKFIDGLGYGGIQQETYDLHVNPWEKEGEKVAGYWVGSEKGKPGHILKGMLDTWLDSLKPYSIDAKGNYKKNKDGKLIRYASQVDNHHRVIGAVQNAINAATAKETVVLPMATFHENIVINKDITIRSEDPTDPAVVANTIVDGYGNGPTIQIKQGCTVNLIGLTITNGYLARGNGAGIQANGNDGEIRNCIISHNRTDNGKEPGIYGFKGTITNCRFTHNVTAEN